MWISLQNGSYATPNGRRSFKMQEYRKHFAYILGLYLKSKKSGPVTEVITCRENRLSKQKQRKNSGKILKLQQRQLCLKYRQKEDRSSHGKAAVSLHILKPLNQAINTRTNSPHRNLKDRFRNQQQRADGHIRGQRLENCKWNECLTSHVYKERWKYRTKYTQLTSLNKSGRLFLRRNDLPC